MGHRPLAAAHSHGQASAFGSESAQLHTIGCRLLFLADSSRPLTQKKFRGEAAHYSISSTWKLIGLLLSLHPLALTQLMGPKDEGKEAMRVTYRMTANPTNQLANGYPYQTGQYCTVAARGGF